MILVTGATGLLGSRICRYLSEQGREVVGLVRANSDTRLLDPIKHQIKIITGDVLYPESMESHLPGVQSVVHCAAIVSFRSADKKKMMEVNIEGTSNMVNLALKYNIPYFVHISSVAAVGRFDEKEIIDESNKWQSEAANSNYAHSKFMSELEVWRGMEEGLNAVILNPSVIIAPDDFERSSGRLFDYVWRENKFYPPGRINFVDVRDICQIVLACMEKKTTGERFILNSAAVSYKALFEGIGKKLRKKPPSVKTNRFLSIVGLILDAARSFLTRSERTVTREIIHVSHSTVYFSNEKAKRYFDVEFTTLEDSLQWACSKILEHRRPLK